VIVFAAPLTLWSGAGGSWHFIAVPPGQCDEIRAHALGSPRGFGSVRVAAAIDDVRWQTSVFPQKSGGYLLPVKADVRRRSGIAAGEVVTVALELI
jgi:3-hydroxymyristoyl/3-hydroxydecanoyl-(acyl carrier protein) dehydratase